MFDAVDVEGRVVHEHVCAAVGVPVLSPHEVDHLLLRQPLFPGVVDPLDDGAAALLVEARRLQQVRHRRPVAERVHAPAGLRRQVQVRLHPLVACKDEYDQRNKSTTRLKLWLPRRAAPLSECGGE